VPAWAARTAPSPPARGRSPGSHAPRGRPRRRRSPSGRRRASPTARAVRRPSPRRRARALRLRAPRRRRTVPPRQGPSPSRRPSELGRAFLERRHWADADILVLEELEPLVQRSRRDRGANRVGDLVRRPRIELARNELLEPEELAEPPEELVLQGCDGDVATVGGLVDGVAGEPA